ncbi:cytochrome c oxidase subunit 3 [Rhodoligotrophos appendicifer]|uniref:cytochrome c oxidase subunit 3 n=1 Tax=Rhodoligotrophos appendicifer TaxID=987056 RepID=UPI0011850A03|nr:cytochrome c oxidase subunit 3 [Rhodoligotrophos appendicifer]
MTDRVQLHEPYSDSGQQHEADMMGMSVFLASEIMLFGGLVIAILVIRYLHPAETVEASKSLHLWIGALNTVVLLTSSLLVALGVTAARAASAWWTTRCLFGVAILGLVFLGLKTYEYSLEYADGVLPVLSDPPRFSGSIEHLFMNVYLMATGLHAVHVSIGIALLAGLAWRVGRGGLQLPQETVTIEVSGLYWHLVDVIWVFLYPILYLAR